jgi:hypothetical protein
LLGKIVVLLSAAGEGVLDGFFFSLLQAQVRTVIPAAEKGRRAETTRYENRAGNGRINLQHEIPK